MITAESPARSERRAIVWIARAVSYLVYFYLLVVEIILLMGFVLLLFGASPTAGFTQWVYRNLDRVMAPFRGIFTPIELGTTSNDVPAIFETSVLFAMIVYGIVALVFGAIIAWLSDRLGQFDEVDAELRRQAEYAAMQAEIDERRMAAARAAAVQAAADQAAGHPAPPPPPAI
ncbi:MAG TPA: hypothetical protein VK853_06330 [Ilumatobacteraceae bacterium]|nr:hypothetical protein [Ilumatobacteraceae bacterium]